MTTLSSSREDRIEVPPQEFLVVWRTGAGYLSTQAGGNTQAEAEEAARVMTARRHQPHWVAQVRSVARTEAPLVEPMVYLGPANDGRSL